MKKQFITIASLILLVSLAMLLVGCQSPGSETSGVTSNPISGVRSDESIQPKSSDASSAQPSRGIQLSGEQYARQQATAGQADVDPQTSLNRMVIYNASLNLIVKDTSTAIEDTRKVIQDAGGYIAASNSYRQDDQLRASITARVPSDKLTETMEQLKKLALSVDSENLKGEDVTDQYTDLESRLRNLEAAETQYLEILKRADKIEDVLAVQRQLDDIRGQIEQSKGRMEYLSKSAAMASVQISLTPDALAQPISIGGWRPQGTAREAFTALVWALRTVGNLLIWLVICVLPVGLILGVPFYFAARWGLRRVRKPRPTAATPVESKK